MWNRNRNRMKNTYVRKKYLQKRTYVWYDKNEQMFER